MWANGGEGSRIPTWLKREVAARQGGQCATCTNPIAQYDHIINVKTLRIPRAQANNPDNMQGLCVPCHKAKTQREAQLARRRHLRPPLRHPADYPG